MRTEIFIPSPTQRRHSLRVLMSVLMCATATCWGGQTAGKQSQNDAVEKPPQNQPAQRFADETAHAAATQAALEPNPEQREQEEEQEELGSIGRKVNATDNLLMKLLDSARVGETDGLIEYGPISVLHPHWLAWNDAMEEKYGLRFGMSYYMLVQFTTPGPDTREAFSGDFDFFGRWKVLRADGGVQGMLGFNLEHRHKYTDLAPSQLGTEIGSIWRTARGFSDSGFNFNELWWDQRFAGDRIWFRVGTINQKHFYDLHRFKSQKQFFLSAPLSDSPTIAFPRNGLGGVVRVSPHDEWHVTAGFGDANGERRVGGFDSFFADGEYFKAVDIAFTPTIEKQGDGRYSLTFWHIDARSDRPSGEGVSLLIEQEIAEGIVPFFRYGYGDGARLAVEHMVALGIGIENPFGREDDVAGFAASWAYPHESGPDQWGLETFYRLQLTRALQFTPGFQLIVDPTLDKSEHVLGIFSFRFGLVF